MSSYTGPPWLYAPTMSVACNLPGCHRLAANGYTTCGRHPPEELKAWGVTHGPTQRVQP